MNRDARFFSACAHPLRLRALVLLAREGELCVCELAHALGAAQPVVSRHLGLLREAGLVSDRRRGQWVHYRIHPGLPAWAQRVLAETAAGLSDRAPYRDDGRRLARMPARPPASRCA